MINFATETRDSIPDDDVGPQNKPISIAKDRKPANTTKPLTAGILLICVFIFIMFTIINTSVGTYLLLNPSGDTTLEGVVEDDDGDPVEGVEIIIDDDSEAAAVTDAKGKYKITEVSAGEHKFKFYKHGYRVVVVRNILYSKDALDQNGLKTNTIDIPSYLPGGAYTGYFKGQYVQAQDNKLANSTVTGTVLGQDGTPMSNVNVSVINTGIFDLTDVSGYFRLENVTAGVHEVKAINGTGNDSEYISIINLIPPGEIVSMGFIFDQDNIDQIFDHREGKTGKITGKVFDDQPDANPVTGAEIWLEPAEKSGNFSTRAITNLNGEFELTDIPIGIYNISASAENYQINMTVNLFVDQEQKSTLNFELAELDSTVKATADLSVIYYCLVGLALIAVIALLGGISAYRRKRYKIAVAASVLSIGPAVIMYTDTCICGAAIISAIVFLLLMLSREEFESDRID
jgi:hypothetical protein